VTLDFLLVIFGKLKEQTFKFNAGFCVDYYDCATVDSYQYCIVTNVPTVADCELNRLKRFPADENEK